MKETSDKAAVRAREIIEEMKAQGLLDDIVPPGQTGVVEIEFADGTVRCEITNDDGPDK